MIISGNEMESLYEKSTFSNIINRINSLNANTPRQWGKMNSSQMLAHCKMPLKLAVGDTRPSRSFLGILFGGLVKKKLMSDIPFEENLPTDRSFIVKDERNFDDEKKQLIELITRFHQNASMEPLVHPFFGKMTSREWDVLQFKHLDHHLRQFGV